MDQSKGAAEEQGVTFAVVVVKGYVTNTASSRREAMLSVAPRFPGVPIVLMTQDGRGRPTYWGPPGIVRFVASISVNALPWKRFS